MALATLNDVRIRVVSDVARAYYEYYLADVSIAITRASAQLLDQMRSVAAARYRTGSATQQDVLRAEVGVGRLCARGPSGAASDRHGL